MLLLLLTLLPFSLGESNNMRYGPVNLPGYWPICDYTVGNPAFSHCVYNAANAVLVKFYHENVFWHVPALGPYYKYPRDFSAINKNFEFTIKRDVKISNLYNSRALSGIFFNPPTLQAFAPVYNKKVTIKGKYKIKGELCGHKRIESEGEVEIIMRKVTYNWTPKVLVDFRNDTNYLHIDKTNSNMTIKLETEIRSVFKDCAGKDVTELNDCMSGRFWKTKNGKDLLAAFAEYFNQLFVTYTNKWLDQCPIWAIYINVPRIAPGNDYN